MTLMKLVKLVQDKQLPDYSITYLLTIVDSSELCPNLKTIV